MMSVEEHFQNARAENRQRISLESWIRSWNFIDLVVADYLGARENSLDRFANEHQYGRDIDWSSRIAFYAEYCERRRLSDCPEVHPIGKRRVCPRGSRFGSPSTRGSY